MNCKSFINFGNANAPPSAIPEPLAAMFSDDNLKLKAVTQQTPRPQRLAKELQGLTLTQRNLQHICKPPYSPALLGWTFKLQQ